MTAEPRFATKRDETRETLGPQVMKVMEALGYRPMPWQRELASIAYELDSDQSLAYSEVIAVVPRQAGKTSLALGVQVHRATAMRKRLESPQRSLYLAQKGLDARNKLVEEHLPILQASRFAPHFTSILRTGNEGIQWNNGSYHHVGAPTAKAGHGGTLDLVQIDEAFVHATNDIEQGVKPTMITRESSQMWIVSAAGNEKSIYLKNKVEMGRETVRQGLQEGICYVEFSADENEDDLEDPQIWAQVHPAIGHTIKAKDLKADFRSMPREEFNRAYLGIWSKKTKPRVVPAEKWDECANVELVPLDPVCFALDVAFDRSSACISVAGRSNDGRIVVEVLRHEQGTGWVVEAVQFLLSKYRNSTISVDPGSSAGSLLPFFERQNINPRLLTTQDVGRSAGFFVDQVNDRKLVHRDDFALNVALGGATQRKIGDKWGWGRTPGVDITPLVSCTFAAWALETAPPARKLWIA